MKRNHVFRAVSGAAFKNSGQGQGKRINDSFPQEGPTGNSQNPDWANQYKRGPRKVMRVRAPKPRVVTATQVLEMSEHEQSEMLPYEFPEDNQRVEAEEMRSTTAIVSAEKTDTDLLIEERAAHFEYPEGIDLEQDPHRPQRRLYRLYQDFEVEHFPAASQAEYIPDKVYQTYKDPQLAEGELQVCIPQTTSMDTYSRRRPGRKSHKFFNGTDGWHMYGQMPTFFQSPSSSAGAAYWANHWRDTDLWKDPYPTTWDMMLDEPTNPLLNAPHGAWEALPLDTETLHPSVLRRSEDMAQKTTVVEDFAGNPHELTTSANSETDLMPTAVVPTPGKWHKQYGMPMQKHVGPLDHIIHETVLPAKLHRAVKHLSLKPIEGNGGQDGMRILCVGDSLTLGACYGTDDYFSTKGPFQLLNDDVKTLHEHPYAKRLHELTNAQVDVVARFREKTTDMRDMMWEVINAAHQHGTKYDLVIIWGGAWDLFDPDTSGDEIAQNLMKMHHVCHMYGSKTVAVNIASVGKKSYGKLFGPRILEINNKLDQFANERRAKMAVTDVYSLTPGRSSMLRVERKAADGHLAAHQRARVGPVYRSGTIEFTPLGYDRVAELIFKTLKHKNGFLQTALPNRFSGTPCAEPHPSQYRMLEDFSRIHKKNASWRKTHASPDIYGSTAEQAEYVFCVFSPPPSILRNIIRETFCTFNLKQCMEFNKTPL